MSEIKSRPSAYNKIPFEFQVALGQFPRYSSNNKFGFNNAVGTTQEEIWNVGGIESYLSSAQTMNIVSTSTNDDGSPVGTGARTLTINGLDNSWLPVQETITLNGQTNVLTSNSYLRVFRMVVNTAGSTGSNVGTITAKASTATTTHAQIDPTNNQTLKINFSVSANKYCLITYAELGVAKADDSQIRFKIRPFGEVFQTKRMLNLFETTVGFSNFEPILVPPKSDITITALSAAGGVSVSANIDYYLIDSLEITG